MAQSYEVRKLTVLHKQNDACFGIGAVGKPRQEKEAGHAKGELVQERKPNGKSKPENK